MRKTIWRYVCGLAVCLPLLLGMDARVPNTLNPLANNLNSFSFDVYRLLASNPNNIVISPFSVASILTVLDSGALDDTARQIEHTLRMVGTNVDLNSEFPQLLRNINQNNGGKPCNKKGCEASTPRLMMKNAFWFQDGLEIDESFLNQLSGPYASYIGTLDFKQDAKDAASNINSWIQQATDNRISQLVTPHELNNDTQILVTNTIYFKGAWFKTFNPRLTQTKSFTLLSNKNLNVPTMFQRGYFDYAENANFQMVVLPYAYSNSVMLLFLPRKQVPFAQAAKSFSFNDMQRLVSTAQYTEVDIELPRFKFVDGLSSLKTLLQALGIHDLFTSEANLSSISMMPLSVSDILQKAYISVNEAGTEAAAASAAKLTNTLVLPPRAPTPLVFNRPFIFAIYDRENNVILFMGQVLDPSQG